MSTTLVTAGARRCFFGMRSANAIKSDLSQLVNKDQKVPKQTMKYHGPQLVQDCDPLEVAQTEEQRQEAESLLLLTLKVKGNDASVLDSYTQFMRRAATVLDLDVSKKVINTLPIQRRALIEPPHVLGDIRVCDLNTHVRMLQLHKMTNESANLFLEYVQENLPEGVSIVIEQSNVGPFVEYLRNYEKDD